MCVYVYKYIYTYIYIYIYIVQGCTGPMSMPAPPGVGATVLASPGTRGVGGVDLVEVLGFVV